MPLFMTESELEAEGGNVDAIVAKADAFIRVLQQQLETHKQACFDVEEMFLTVGLRFHRQLLIPLKNQT